MRFRKTPAVARQATSRGKFPRIEGGGNAMPKRERCQSWTLGDEEWPRRNNESARAKLSEPREHRLDIAFRAGLKDVKLESERSGCRLHLRQQRLSNGPIGRVDEQAHGLHIRDELVQELQPLRVHLHVQRRYAGHVATRPA